MNKTTSTTTKGIRRGRLDAIIAPPDGVKLTLPPKVEYQPTPVDKFKAWFTKRFGSKEARANTSKAVGKRYHSIMYSVSRTLRFNLVLALIAMLVVQFCPHLLNTCPVFFQICEGILTFYEFIIRACFTALSALFQVFFLQFEDGFTSIYNIFSEFGELISQFLNWLSTITF